MQLNSEGGIEMTTKICKEKIQSIEKWTDAFLIYTSVFLTALQDKAIELMHYMFLIREAASKQRGSFCWRDYDEQFRIRQANYPSSWSVINNDLWWHCMQIRAADPISQSAGGAAEKNHTIVMTSIRVLVTGSTVDFLIFVPAVGPYNMGPLHVITSSITHHPIRHSPM